MYDWQPVRELSQSKQNRDHEYYCDTCTVHMIAMYTIYYLYCLVLSKLEQLSSSLAVQVNTPILLLGGLTLTLYSDLLYSAGPEISGSCIKLAL